MRWLWWVLATPLLAQQFPSTAGRLQDLDFVVNTIPARHPNFFFQLDPAQFQQAADRLRTNVSTLTGAQFYVGITQLVAMAGDAHTSIALAGVPLRVFPLRFRWLDDGIFVTRASARYSVALGKRLVRMGDLNIDEVVRRVGTVLSHENDQWLHNASVNYLVGQSVLQGLGVLPDSPTSQLTFQSLDGSEFTLDVDSDPATLDPAPSAAKGPVPAYLQNAGVNYWYLYSPANRLLYFKYNSCTEIPGNPFATFAADLLNTLDLNPVDTLVFDFRGNGGGASAIIAPLFNGLAQRYAALSANPKFRIYDAFDKGTFSSALFNAVDLKIPVPSSIPTSNWSVNLSKFVTSIGEPTGGKPAGYGNVSAFTLPASGFTGQVSTRYFNAPAGIPDGPWLAPDISISTRSTDYFARFDPVMAAILARSNGAPTVPSGELITVNGATYRTDHGIAPGSFASAFGAFSSTPDGVLIGGLSAQISSTSKSQINFIVPDSLAVGSTVISAWASGQKLTEGRLTISATGPGIFVLDSANPAQPGAVLNQDGSISQTAPGSVAQIFATGYSPAPIKVFFADLPAEILYSGPLAAFPGLWQINARVPEGLSGEVPLFIVSGASPSNGVTISVQ